MARLGHGIRCDRRVPGPDGAGAAAGTAALYDRLAPRPAGPRMVGRSGARGPPRPGGRLRAAPRPRAAASAGADRGTRDRTVSAAWSPRRRALGARGRDRPPPFGLLRDGAGSVPP